MSSVAAGQDFVRTVKGIIRKRKEQIATFREEENEVRKFVLESFRRLGRAPTLAEIAKDLKMNEERAEASLRKLDAADMLYLEGGRIVAAYPFSNQPTPHEVTFTRDGTRTYSMCAIDALGIAFMFGESVVISSRCGHCNKRLEIQVGDRAGSPDEEIMVFFGFARSEHAATSSCPILQFFCSRAHLDSWRVANPSKLGAPLNLEEATSLGKEIFGGTLV